MPFDKDKAAKWIRANALPPFGNQKCATYVRQAIEAGGLSTTGHPIYAKDWGPTLIRIGFRDVTDIIGDAFDVGDVIVMQAPKGTTGGHIELYDGKNWVSDFVQREMWPGPSFRTEKPKYEVYRYYS